MPRGKRTILPPKISESEQTAASPAKKTKINNNQQELINAQLLTP